MLQTSSLFQLHYKNIASTKINELETKMMSATCEQQPSPRPIKSELRQRKPYNVSTDDLEVNIRAAATIGERRKEVLLAEVHGQKFKTEHIYD